MTWIDVAWRIIVTALCGCGISGIIILFSWEYRKIFRWTFYKWAKERPGMAPRCPDAGMWTGFAAWTTAIAGLALLAIAIWM